jgi:putative ABC transport system substrate-binding protein
MGCSTGRATIHLATRAIYTAALWLWLALPCAAQAGPLPKIGELWFPDTAAAAPFTTAFRQGLRELGYVDGRNVEIITRYADGDATRLPSLLSELVALGVDVLYISPRALEPARQGAKTIPVVTSGFTDPVVEGFAASMAKPGGNFTGLSWQSAETVAKRLELAREIVPGLRRVGLLYDPRDPQPLIEANSFRTLARNARLQVQTFKLPASPKDKTFLDFVARHRPQALFVIDSPLAIQRRESICRLAIAKRIPLFSETTVFAQSGGMVSYGADGLDLFRRGAGYVDKILRGAKAADLPIEQPTKFLLVVNLKTAEAVQTSIPESVLIRADEVLR